jgi:hypothetical protein
VQLLSNDKFNTIAMVIFFSIWAYTEVAEKIERHQFHEAFQHFHDAGPLFTAADGAAMQAEVEDLQRQVDQLTAQPFKK